MEVHARLIEDASREIAAGQQTAERRRRRVVRLANLIRAIDQVLFDLEELNVQGVDRVPAALRARAATILDLLPAPGIDEEPRELRLRHRVQPLMDVLFDAQEVLLRIQDPGRAREDDRPA